MSRARLPILIPPVAALAFATAALAVVTSRESTPARRRPPRRARGRPPGDTPEPPPSAAAPAASTRPRGAAGTDPLAAIGGGRGSAGGRLLRGVRLPAESESFVTWDPVKRRSPNRAWRRWGTDRLVRLLLTVAREYAAANPRAPRMAVGDLSRPRGGDFGPVRLHRTREPPERARRRRLPPARRRNGARRRAQRRSTAGCLSGSWTASWRRAPRSCWSAGDRPDRPGRVQTLVNHDNHLHVRIR